MAQGWCIHVRPLLKSSTHLSRCLMQYMRHPADVSFCMYKATITVPLPCLFLIEETILAVLLSTLKVLCRWWLLGKMIMPLMCPLRWSSTCWQLPAFLTISLAPTLLCRKVWLHLIHSLWKLGPSSWAIQHICGTEQMLLHFGAWLKLRSSCDCELPRDIISQLNSRRRGLDSRGRR